MLEIAKTGEGTQVQIKLTGRLDTTTSPNLEKEIQAVCDAGATQIVLELSALDYVSSAGLRVILGTQKKMNAIKGQLIVRHPNEMVSEVFDATGFSDILTIEA